MRRATRRDSRQHPAGEFSIHALLAESDSASDSLSDTSDVFSIHALLAESDHPQSSNHHHNTSFLSTLSLRRATVMVGLLMCNLCFLSTLSLRRATLRWVNCFGQLLLFYPRSPCGERLPSITGYFFNAMLFYPRSPCGERHDLEPSSTRRFTFLSTLSLRRATNFNGRRYDFGRAFLSTLSLRRATTI